MSYLGFFMEVGRLKSTRRMGWIAKGVSDPESVAEHSYRTALIAALLCSKRIDVAKAMKMALVHDLAEVATGDFIKKPDESQQDLSNQKQAELELAAIKEIAASLPEPQATEVVALWQEYQKGKTPESIAIKELGKIEMTLQALEYEITGNHKKSLDEFYQYSEMHVKTPEYRALLEEINAQRKKRQGLA